MNRDEAVESAERVVEFFREMESSGFLTNLATEAQMGNHIAQKFLGIVGGDSPVRQDILTVAEHIVDTASSPPSRKTRQQVENDDDDDYTSRPYDKEGTGMERESDDYEYQEEHRRQVRKPRPRPRRAADPAGVQRI